MRLSFHFRFRKREKGNIRAIRCCATWMMLTFSHAAQGPGQACPRVSGGSEKASFVLDRTSGLSKYNSLSDRQQKSGYL